MLRSLLCSLAALAVFAGLTIGVANAGPELVPSSAPSCEKATNEEAAARVAVNEAEKAERQARINAKADPPGVEVTPTEQTLIDAAVGEVLRLRVILDRKVAARTAACVAPPTSTTTPPTSTTTPPPSTTTSAPPPPASTTPAPKDEFDCPDFPLSDGRTAQQVLDADRSDPHNLDRDKDGKACEVDEGAPPVVLLPVPVACNDLRTRQDLDREAVRQLIRRINDLNNTYRTTPKLTDEQIRLIREAYGAFDTRASQWRRLVDERRSVCRDNGGDTRIDVTINEAPAPVRSVVGSSSGSSSSLPRGGVETGGI